MTMRRLNTVNVQRGFRAGALLSALLLCEGLVCSTAVADSVMALPGGGELIMVTFDELDQGTRFPLSYRGVTYTRLEAPEPSVLTVIWTSPELPITRYVKTPMLAMTSADEDPAEPTNPISLRLDFDQSTPFFGFGLGFNDRELLSKVVFNRMNQAAA
jgi:hypothetical protein